jgi:hypothetical protein
VTKRGTVRRPTEAELADLHYLLLEWRSAYPEAMPPEIWEKLNKIIDWQKWQYRDYIRFMRYVWVRRGIEREGSLKRALAYAEDVLKGTPAQAGIEMIKKDYYAFWRTSPKSRRRH